MDLFNCFLRIIQKKKKKKKDSKSGTFQNIRRNIKFHIALRICSSLVKELIAIACIALEVVLLEQLLHRSFDVRRGRGKLTPQDAYHSFAQAGKVEAPSGLHHRDDSSLQNETAALKRNVFRSGLVLLLLVFRHCCSCRCGLSSESFRKQTNAFLLKLAGSVELDYTNSCCCFRSRRASHRHELHLFHSMQRHSCLAVFSICYSLNLFGIEYVRSDHIHLEQDGCDGHWNEELN